MGPFASTSEILSVVLFDFNIKLIKFNQWIVKDWKIFLVEARKMEVCISEFSVRHHQFLLNMFLLNQKRKIVIEMDLDLSSDG